MARIKASNKKRIVLVFGIMSIMMALLVMRMAWVQVVKGQEYNEKAVAQQTSDIPIKAKRGDILDRNGKELASSATCYTLWIRPEEMRNEYNKQKLEEVANKLAVPLSMDGAEVLKELNSDSKLMVLKRYLEKTEADKVRELKIYGTELVEETKRYYPLGAFASVALGTVNSEGVGTSGVEQEYNNYLTGVSGRWVKNSDIEGNTLAYGEKKFYGAEDGVSVVLTLDEVVQHYLESAMADGYKKTKADQVRGVVLNPKTGEVLAMGTYPTFDPNTPSKPADSEELAKFNSLSNEDKAKYLSKMWRNPLVSDVYEPGSTFKLLTASATLEEGTGTPDTTYNCAGGYTVHGTTLHCWGAPHGNLTLKQAVGVSCNPAHIQMAEKLGKDKYYDYLDLFGITEYTGIDLPAEAGSIIQPKESTGPVELATMGFGHGIALTPIELVTAIGAIGNDGMLMKPHIVKAFKGADGKIVKEVKPELVKKVISKKTAVQMKDIMEYEVAESGGFTARIPGYRIGGKTGTANKAIEGGYSKEVVCSFVCLAPADDPKLAVLIIVDNPRVGNYGSDTAAPIAKEFLLKALPYINASKDEHDNKESSGVQYVPEITGKTYKEAKEILNGHGILSEVRPALKDGEKEEDLDFKVIDQYPKAGKKLEKDGKVLIYRE